MDKKNEERIVYKRPYHTMAEKLQNMRKQDELCDVTIQVGEKCFRAHKVVLSTAMDYFRQMFLPNSKEVDQKIIWVIPDIKPENMETFINFAYSGEIEFNEQNVQSLLIDADHLGVTDIKTYGVKFIDSIGKPTNAFSMYRIAKDLEYPTLMEKLRGIITNNFSEAMKSQEFLNISSEFLGDILKSEDVQLGSSEVAFDGLMKWMAHNIDERKHDLTNFLELVDLSRSNAAYLTEYFFRADMIAISTEHKDLLHIVMSKYYRNKIPNVVNNGIINNHKGSILALCVYDNKLYFETYNFQADEWSPSNWTLKWTDTVSSSCVHDDVVYLSDKKGNVYSIDVQQRCVEKLRRMQKYFKSQALIVLDGFLYNFIFDYDWKSGFTGSRYCFKSKQWETIPPMNVGHQIFRFVVCQDYIYAIEAVESNSVQRYWPKNNKWEIVYGGRVDVRQLFRTAVLNGKIYICGGSINDVESNAVESFDPETKGWQQLASMNQTRFDHSVAACNGKLWAIGGYGEKSSELSSVEVYDPTSNSWSMVSQMKKVKGRVFGGVLSNLQSVE